MVETQEITDRYAMYNGDCIEVLANLPGDYIHMSTYSPPFSGLYLYSSSENDLSNCKSKEEFLEHYAFVVRELYRITMPGRITVVHCTDLPASRHGISDFPGDIVRLHEKCGWIYHDRKIVWKEPLKVAIRTRALGLTHRQIVKDATLCRSALADHALAFRKPGTNPIPVEHPLGLTTYAGSNPPSPALFEKYKDWKNPQTNKLAHKIWQKYASSVWDDIRENRVLPYRDARESEEEKHCHPSTLDYVERVVQLWTNPNEIVLSPFAGVGSEPYGALSAGRRAFGVELKASYFRQAISNIHSLSDSASQRELSLEIDPADEWPDFEASEEDE